MQDIPYKDEEVEGRPKFRLIRGFYDGLVGQYTLVETDKKKDRKLISLLEQIIDTNYSEEMREEVEGIMDRANVLEVRRYKDRSFVVKYSYRATDFLLVHFRESGELITYTFTSNERQPFEISAWLCGEHDEDNITSRWEDVVDFCWMAKSNTGCFINAGDECYLQMWADGDGDEGSFRVSFCFGLSQVFEITKTFTSRADMIDCIKLYMRCGTSAAQSCAQGWVCDVATYNEREMHYNLANALHADYLHAKRMGMNAVKYTLSHFYDWEQRSICDSLTLIVRNGDKDRIFRQVRTAAKKNRKQFLAYRKYEDDWKIDLYLAIRGDKSAMRQIASVLNETDAPRLANYWLRKARGLPASYDPIVKKPRIRKRFVDPRQQLLDI